jgi:hypothetical protein
MPLSTELVAQGPDQISAALSVASLFTFWITLVFPIITAFFWPWWTSVWGWNIISLDAGSCVSLLPAPLHAIFGIPYGPVLNWFQIGAVFLFGLIIIWRTVIIWIVQRRESLRGEDPDATEH